MAGDLLGARLAVSADGTRLVATATGRNSGGGFVVVFVRDGDNWLQEAMLVGSNTEAGDRFGRNVAMSADGATIAVSANLEDSVAVGINGDGTNNTAPDSGAVYIFTRTGSTWSQDAYIKASVVTADFGTSVSLSTDGTTLVVGAFSEGSAAGAVYVFTRTGTTWSQLARLTASNAQAGDRFGEDVSISGDGNFIAVSAPLESSIATGIDGDETDNSAVEAGAVYVFARSGAGWAQTAYVKASNTALSQPVGSFDQFGWGVSLSAAGDTLAVGARFEGSSATGVDADQQNDGAGGSGATYVFTRAGMVWTQQAYIKAPNVTANDFCGETVRLSADGNALAIIAPFEDGAASGLDGPIDDGAPDSGAVWRLTREGALWTHRSYLKATTTEAGDNASGLAMSADGTTIALGAALEDGNGSTPMDNSLTDSGAVYVYW